ncbi:hypothetical protein MBLNU459_g0371t1 [Dothideomycetes sp. NU459]
MSGYGKPQAYAYDYGTATRPDQASGYPAFVQPQYGISYTGTHAQVPSGLPNAAELPLLSEDQYQAHDSPYNQHNTSYSSFIPAASRNLPEVTSFSPTQGQAGRKLFVYLHATEDLETPPNTLFTVMFGTKRCESYLAKLSNQSQRSNYALSVDVPPFDSTGSSSTHVPLYLEMSDGSNPSMSMPLEFGHYSYTDATSFQLSSPSQSSLRKRKLSPANDSPQSPKRSATQNLRDSPINSSDGNLNKISPPATAVVDLYANRAQQPNQINYPRAYNAPQQYQQTLHSSPTYGPGQQAASAQMTMGGTQYNSYPTYMSNDRTQVPMQSQGMPNASGGVNPPLVRTTALHSSPTTTTPSAASFNPYAIYPSNAKAILKLEGELNNMAGDWTQDEQMARRRIVRFRRSQNGSTISASFEPVTPEEHAQAPGCIYVNCIYWEEKQQCFITSVDTIQLLESLVAVRFTVEEKNRIRRNLEGFRPLTVSKTRQDCEEFFKIIMGFPSPKPRNIEKDVKVFPWRILSHALKKIIGKYSASYSSTAGALPSPPGVPAQGRQQMHASSPPSAGSSNGSMGFAQSMAAANLSPHHAGVSAGMNHVSAGHPDLRIGIPPSQNVSWHQPSQNYTTDLSSAGRASWDFSQYLDQASPTGNSMQPYQRIPSISQSLGFNFVQPQEWKDYPQRTTHA